MPSIPDMSLESAASSGRPSPVPAPRSATPDVRVLRSAKALAGGLPLSAVIGRAELMDAGRAQRIEELLDDGLTVTEKAVRAL